VHHRHCRERERERERERGQETKGGGDYSKPWMHINTLLEPHAEERGHVSPSLPRRRARSLKSFLSQVMFCEGSGMGRSSLRSPPWMCTRMHGAGMSISPPGSGGGGRGVSITMPPYKRWGKEEGSNRAANRNRQVGELRPHGDMMAHLQAACGRQKTIRSGAIER